MCYHHSIKYSIPKIESDYGVKFPYSPNYNPQLPTVFNAFTFPYMPVLFLDKENKLTANYFRWGLIPAWSANEDIKAYTLNAKFETLAEKPSFKSITHQKCIIVSSHFFEWQWQDEKGKKKIKYAISSKTSDYCNLGGLYSLWKNPTTGEIIHTCTIITKPANQLMSAINNHTKRMPLIISNNNEMPWLLNKLIETNDMELNFEKL